jgi:hypothetical protein
MGYRGEEFFPTRQAVHSNHIRTENASIGLRLRAKKYPDKRGIF